MKRMKLVLLSAFITASLFQISGCRKNDWTSIPNGRDKCDFVSGSSTSISNDGTTLVPVFKKKYKPGTFKLEELLVQQLATVGSYYDPVTFKVSYSGQKMFLVKHGNDTTTIEFDAQGKPRKVSSTEGFNPLTNYKFNYNNAGKLSEIKFQYPEDTNDPTWYSFAKISYDGKKNVTKLVFHDGLRPYPDTYTYSYDYSKKPNGQYHPDEAYGQVYLFWQFIKHLNLFPELQSENLLTGWTYTEDPEGYFKQVVTTYSNQLFDSKNKLISYKANRIEFGDNYPSTWFVDWNCLDKK
ncbi:MAG: hypothetical protein ABWZ25_13500 [Chitinophagaceae bacterium]